MLYIYTYITNTKEQNIFLDNCITNDSKCSKNYNKQ